MASVTYNSTALPNVYGPYDFGNDYETARFSCNFVLKAANSTALLTARRNLESKLREPLEDLAVVFDGGSHFSLSHDDNTGMNPKVSIQSTSDVIGTTAQSFRFTYSCELEADKSGFDYRQDSNISVEFDAANIRTIRASVTYTASSSPVASASENVESFAEGFVEAILDDRFGGSGNYNLVSFRIENRDQDKKATGNLVYREITEDETEAALNNANIKDVSCTFRLNRSNLVGESPTGGFIMDPLVNISVNYSCKILKSVSSTSAVEALWSSTIKPWILKRSKEILNLSNVGAAGQNYIAKDDNFSFDPNTYSLTASLVVVAPKTNSSIVALSESIDSNFDSGIRDEKLFDGIDHSVFEYGVGAQEIITRSITVARYSVEPADPPFLSDTDNTLSFRTRRKSQAQVIEGKATALDSGEVVQLKLITKSFVDTYKRVNPEASVISDLIL